MNSRKWQAGMLSMVILSMGTLAPVPFVWRYLRLRDKDAVTAIAIVAPTWIFAWVLTALDSNWAVIPIIAVMVAGGIEAWHLFRPYRKDEIVPERGL